MSKLRLLLDVDEVICFSGYLELVNAFLKKNYTIDDFTNYYIDEEAIPKEKMAEFNKFISDKDQYGNPVFLPGAIDAIIRLSEIYDIYLCTDCRNPFDLENSGRIFASKFNLLYRTFPQSVIPAKNYIFTGIKNIFKADVQVDDLVRNFDLDIEGKFLFPSYHNKNIPEDELLQKGIVRAGSEWKEGWCILEQQLIEYYKTRKNPVLARKLQG